MRCAPLQKVCTFRAAAYAPPFFGVELSAALTARPVRVC